MQREGWETAQQRLEDFEYWCRIQAANLGTLTYEQKRLALHALNGSVRVWSTEHDPRYAFTLELEGLVPGQALNGPRPASGGDHVLAHVDGYSSRGCVHNRPALTLRWTDQDLSLEPGRLPRCH